MGYGYKVTKKVDSFYWQFTYNDEVLTFEENATNKGVLNLFKNTVEDNKLALFQLILLSIYFLVIVVLIIVGIRNKKMKDKRFLSFAILAVLMASTFFLISYLDFAASLKDLNYVYQEAKLLR